MRIWDSGPGTSGSGPRLVRYYGFTLDEESEVVITLESQDADTYT